MVDLRKPRRMTSHRTVAFVLVVLDLASFVLVFNLISYLRGLSFADGMIVEPLVAPLAALVFAIYLVEGYRPRTDMLGLDYTSQHLIAVIGAMLATLLWTYALVSTDVVYGLHSSRAVIALSFLTVMPMTLGYRRVIYLRLAASREIRNLVFVGDRGSCGTFREECRKMEMTQRVIFALPDADIAEHGAELSTFSSVLDDLQRGRIEVEAIVLRETAAELAPDVSRQLVQLYFAGVPTYTLELFHQVYWQKIPLYRLNQTWLFQEGFQIAREPVFDRIKRATDIGLSAIGLLVLLPLIAAGALAVWLEDRGPALFAQSRIGKNHVSFRLLKLRTMRPPKTDDDLYTQPGDARVTRVGRFLRASRFDELPQLWNVLQGDMSLIGPRAEWDRLVETYEREIPCYHFRHLVKPGITGWAQVNYSYGANLEDTTRKLEYDLYYIRHFSFLLDAAILLKTIHIMLFGKGR
jgi:exopolysaccharide biosynthesis polyprenyl glycosylphosphotransferase